VVGWLRRCLLDNDYPVYYSSGRIQFEDVRLEGAGTPESSVIITFRAPGRPGCLYGRREDAVGPPEPLPLEDPSGAPELWAQMVWILLEEDILTGPRLPKKCVPGRVTWI
jgi:hypothetical protein